MKKSKLTSYISKEEGEILKKTAGIVILIVILAIPLIMLGRTPVGKAMGSLLGAFAGLVGTAAAQIERCNKVGYFNASKGCWVGIGAIVLGVFVIFGKYVFPLLMKNGPAKDLVTSASAASGESEVKITIDIVNQVQADIDSLNEQFEKMSPEAKDVLVQKLFARRAFAKGAEARAKQAESPETKKADAAARTAAAEAESAANEELEAAAELTQEQKDSVNNEVDNIIPEPAPIPV